MAWVIDKRDKFYEDLPLCESCVHKGQCNDLQLLILTIQDTHESWQHNGMLAVTKCDGFEDERKVWP